MRCQYCQVAEAYCLCSYQPDIASKIAVMLLVSDNEVFKPSNTGRLIVDTIKESYVYQWSRTEPDSQMLALLADPAYQPIIVFPDEYVDDRQRLLGENVTSISENKIPLIILLDGSWREARRIFRKSPYLDELPVLSINPDAISQYMMRQSEKEQHLSTAEVATLVFEQLGEELASKTLKQWFEVFKESYMLSKTRMKTDKSRPVLQQYIEEQQNKERHG